MRSTFSAESILTAILTSLTSTILVIAMHESVLAAEAPREPALSSWSFQEQRFSVATFEKQKVMISAECIVAPGKFKCDAWSALQKAKSTKLDFNTLIGGAHPGAVLCEKKLSGRVQIARDSERNENCFCQFPDQSRMDCGTLFSHSIQN